MSDFFSHGHEAALKGFRKIPASKALSREAYGTCVVPVNGTFLCVNWKTGVQDGLKWRQGLGLYLGLDTVTRQQNAS